MESIYRESSTVVVAEYYLTGMLRGLKKRAWNLATLATFVKYPFSPSTYNLVIRAVNVENSTR